ncbi:hypothetical protein PGB90_006429 [Kerria lacca]
MSYSDLGRRLVEPYRLAGRLPDSNSCVKFWAFPIELRCSVFNFRLIVNSPLFCDKATSLPNKLYFFLKYTELSRSVNESLEDCNSSFSKFSDGICFDF